MNFLESFLSLCTLFTFLSVCLFVCFFFAPQLYNNKTEVQQIKNQTTKEGYLL